jgi:putative ABC transport system permease protein
MSIISNVFRRKGRAFLTIFGITIGVFALVVMGAMAEKLNLLVDGGITYYGDKVTVTDSGASSGFGGPLSIGKVADIERVSGVARASASLGMMLEKDQGASIGVPPMIMASDHRSTGYEKFQITYAEGRALTAADKGCVTLGSDMAIKFDAHVGDTIEVRDTKFRVIGVLDKTLTAPDQCVNMNLADGQELFLDDLPAAVRGRINKNDMCTSIAVYPDKGVDPEQLARAIERRVTGIKADGPSAFQKQVGESMAMFNGIIFSIALISLIVGGMSVVNTMTMAVSERTREIGIRKAIGAASHKIVGQFVAESALIGFVGGLTGLAIGALAANGMNAASAASGTVLFLVSPRLSVGALAFAMFIGVVSGLYPAIHAAGLNPVMALRHE